MIAFGFMMWVCSGCGDIARDFFENNIGDGASVEMGFSENYTKLDITFTWLQGRGKKMIPKHHSIQLNWPDEKEKLWPKEIEAAEEILKKQKAGKVTALDFRVFKDRESLFVRYPDDLKDRMPLKRE